MIVQSNDFFFFEISIKILGKLFVNQIVFLCFLFWYIFLYIMCKFNDVLRKNDTDDFRANWFLLGSFGLFSPIECVSHRYKSFPAPLTKTVSQTVFCITKRSTNSTITCIYIFNNQNTFPKISFKIFLQCFHKKTIFTILHIETIPFKSVDPSNWSTTRNFLNKIDNHWLRGDSWSRYPCSSNMDSINAD